MTIIEAWWKRHFSDPETLWLFILLFFGLAMIVWLSDMLAPVFASIVIAYLLQWAINILRRYKVPHLISVAIIFIGFLALFLSLIFVLWPVVWQQSLRLVEELPAMFTRAQTLLYVLPEKFPEFISDADIEDLTANALNQLSRMAKTFLSASLASLPGIIAFIVYLFLVPLMVFFLLKDKNQIIRWVTAFLPEKKRLLKRVWLEVDDQIGNYVRGKVAEVVIVGIATYVVLAYFRMEYALLLSLLVGLSVLVPYIGAVVVTFPVVLVAFFQWGWGADFAYVLIAYSVVQALDGVLLVPLLFSEAVNLHPVGIIIAILFFGGLWGFWGVFFAIPLATLVKAVINAWRESQSTSIA